MAEGALPQRVGYPPSSITGPLFVYLTQVAAAINNMPVFSFTSYNGGPNSSVSANPGTLLVNIVSSAQTARLYIKELGSGNTGWVSVQTM